VDEPSQYTTRQLTGSSSASKRRMVLGYFGFGRIIYVSLLFTNAIAILNEERFLAKSQYTRQLCSM